MAVLMEINATATAASMEEVGGWGSHLMVEEEEGAFGAERAVVGEPTGLRLLLGRRIVGEYVPSWRKWRFRRPFRLLVNDARFRGIPMTLETDKGPDLAEDRENLRVLRSLIE